MALSSPSNEFEGIAKSYLQILSYLIASQIITQSTAPKSTDEIVTLYLTLKRIVQNANFPRFNNRSNLQAERDEEELDFEENFGNQSLPSNLEIKRYDKSYWCTPYINFNLSLSCKYQMCFSGVYVAQ